jgi:hypothetical protein
MKICTRCDGNQTHDYLGEHGEKRNSIVTLKKPKNQTKELGDHPCILEMGKKILGAIQLDKKKLHSDRLKCPG